MTQAKLQTRLHPPIDLVTIVAAVAAQILMDISQQEKGSLMAIKVLLPTPLGEEAMNVVKKLAEKSELKITSDK